MDRYPGEPRPLRLEWWGGAKDVTNEGLLRPLLGRTVVRLEHAVLDQRGEWDTSDSNHLAPENVVFTMMEGDRWELLDAQNSDMQLLLFKEIKSDAELVTAGDLQREPGEQPWAVALEGLHYPLPWTVAGITEAWTVYEGQPFLHAALLWGDPRVSSDAGRPPFSGWTPLLAVYVSYDSFWITTAEQVLAGLDDDLFSVGNMHYRFYHTKRE